MLARASPRRSGDELAGIAASSQEERVAAQYCLADVELAAFLDEPVVPWEIDDVTRLIHDQQRDDAFAPIRSMTVGELRDWLLSDETTTTDLADVAWGLTPEMVAAVSKIMGNQDLVLVASKCSNVTAFRSTIGLPGRLAVRLQPNHPTDDLRGIMAAIVDGLLLGCGDAVIGINPALDSPQHNRRLLDMLDALIGRYEIPTQSCVLAHVTTTLRAIDDGAPVDLVFQSIAGTEATNRSFGITLDLLAEAHERGPLAATRHRRNAGDVLRDRTGFVSVGRRAPRCRSADARGSRPTPSPGDSIRSSSTPSSGSSGPEYLLDGKQVTRAGLEDHFCGKLLGLPMGCDVCYTNHMDVDQDDMDVLLTALGAAGCNYIMGVPGGDDVMLGYQSTSFHDAQYVRRVLGLRPAPEFEAWLQRMDLVDDRGRLSAPSGTPALMAALDLAR